MNTPPTESVAPLDAYATAKPGEPTWTVQGGDALGGPLLRVWALFARIQAGVIPDQGAHGTFEQILKAANNNPPASDREAEALLIRATATEEVSWDMDTYRRGGSGAVKAETPTENPVDEKFRLDLYDRRVHAVTKLHNARGYVEEILVELVPDMLIAGVCDEALLDQLDAVSKALATVTDAIEYRRLFKKH